MPAGRELAPGTASALPFRPMTTRDVLAALPGTGITLTDSCAMIPEASVCGLVIAHRDASYCNIRRVDAAALEAYSARRGFSAEECELFLSHLR